MKITKLLKAIFNNKGFSLIEMIMIIVALGILMPVVLMPFIESSKGMGIATEASKIVYVVRSNLAGEMEAVDTTWPVAPTVNANGAYTRATVNEIVGGDNFSTVITGQFMDKNYVNTNGVAPNNKYLWLTVTTNSPDSGNTITLNVLKSFSYP